MQPIAPPDILSIRAFAFGVFGSIAVEVVQIVALHERGRQFPARYRRWSFWGNRILLAGIGGGLAAAYHIQSDILAIHVGATAPAIIDTFIRRPAVGAPTE